MKTFFFMGLNPKTVSGVSWKIWKIERQGSTITTWWGPAKLLRRQVLQKGKLRSKRRRFRSAAAALDFERELIRKKLTKGYERTPRRRH